MTVITGVSGSGKSSLAIDTLYAEGQRRYIETFSPYARQFMDRMDRPLADKIEGIPPAIAIDQKDPVRTSRSTVGTMTEITDYVKLLYARLGQLHCESCGRPVISESVEFILSQLKGFEKGIETIITFPFSSKTALEGFKTKKGKSDDEAKKLLIQMGFDRVYIDGHIESIEALQIHGKTLNMVADRVRLAPKNNRRIVDSLEQAFRFGGGRLDVWMPPNRHMAFSKHLSCPNCSIHYSPPLPNLFSFNSPIGACETCRGFGRTIDIDMDLIIPDPNLSIEEGAIKPWGSSKERRFEFNDLVRFCRRKKIPTNKPFKRLKQIQIASIVDGTSKYYGIRGFFKWLETKTYKMPVRVFLSRYRSYDVCPDCRGTRFKKETLLYRLGGKTIAEVYEKNVNLALAFFESLATPGDDAGRMVLAEVLQRLRYLCDVGLGYLTIDRQSRTLSGGEVQRVALASAMGASLVNTLYVLDEPSIGLHPRDIHRLLKILKGLRDHSNTVVVVEHDPEIIRESDHILDLGPGAGENGGHVIYFGPTAKIQKSLTGDYLTGRRKIPVPKSVRRPKPGKWMGVKGASENNLKSIDVDIPLGCFVCLTGVSGSGKSTLAEEILYKAIKREKGDSVGRPGQYTRISGTRTVSDVVMVDQSAIGRTPRANPVTYTKALDPIRRLLADTPEARRKQFGPGHFSFNVTGGRCETCKGEGFEKVEMQFLSDVFITCPDCKGKRFKNEVLGVYYKTKNIDDILNMTVDTALDFFSDHVKIITALTPLSDVGLGYLRLGQPINTLSGGESQRLKLSRHLKDNKTKGRFFIFDEPTTGLHFEDIGNLIAALHRLVDQGHTVLVIEHNMDVVKTADWVIDLGPEGGDDGGRIVATGSPTVLAQQKNSHTGRFLKAYLNGKRKLPAKTTGQRRVSEKASEYSVLSGANEMVVQGAREHNLKNLSLSIPHHRFIALTGVSGSGKSTLAFDILFAEGQRRYLESLAPYVRQFVKILERPEVDLVSGLSPTVAIEQRISHAGRRSTVATITEIYHYLRLLFSKIGKQHCPGCGRRLSTQTRQHIIDQIVERYGSENVAVLAPKVSGRKGFHKDVLARALKRGFQTAWIDGVFENIVEGMALSRYHEHTVEMVVGTIESRKTSAASIEALVDSALTEGAGTLVVREHPEKNRNTSSGFEEVFSIHGICPACGTGMTRLDPRLFSFNSRYGACPACEGLGDIEVDKPDGNGVRKPCPQCSGSRLKKEALSVKIGSVTIWDIIRQPADQMYETVKALSFNLKEAPIGEPIKKEILTRLALMNQLGLSYLSLGRSGDTLSGGEAQRVRLAAQLGSNLTGVSYILDEPTIGLHPRDNAVLVDALKTLKNRGNTIIVVEHDEDTIRAADVIIDLGPGAGQQGGHVVASGRLDDLKKAAESVTGSLIDGGARRITSRQRNYRKQPRITIRGAAANNLNGLDVNVPLGCFICVTGVSGSGKSTLVKETLFKGLRNRLSEHQQSAGTCRRIDGWRSLSRCLEVDHSPIGRTPRSVPASYVGLLLNIRQLFASTPEARARGYSPGRFSFNLAEGRCPSCKGQGHPKVEMSFLPDVYVPCELCRGKRFNRETLAVTFKGKTIAGVLEMTFEEAVGFFSAIPSVRRPTQFVCDIGLGYLRLGQPSPTLSGGEAQRIKLAKQLVKPSNGHTLYVLDEPSTGLHLSDVKQLIDVLQSIIDQQNTIVVIEHNLEIIKSADYIIDLGPEGGDKGGNVVATGSPEELLDQTTRSHTARYLKNYLKSFGTV